MTCEGTFDTNRALTCYVMQLYYILGIKQLEFRTIDLSKLRSMEIES